MVIELKYNKSDNRAVNKDLQNGVSVSGEMNQELNLLRPVIDLYYNGVMRYNYVYIPELQRYYYIVGKTIIADGICRVEMEVDPLMSFRRDVLATSALIDKSATKSHGDEYIDDGSLVSDNYNFATIVNFSGGFNNTPELILITMG